MYGKICDVLTRDVLGCITKCCFECRQKNCTSSDIKLFSRTTVSNWFRSYTSPGCSNTYSPQCEAVPWDGGWFVTQSTIEYAMFRDMGTISDMTPMSRLPAALAKQLRKQGKLGTEHKDIVSLKITTAVPHSAHTQ